MIEYFLRIFRSENRKTIKIERLILETNYIKFELAQI
jgi:hypothetical protein